jgi:hypothetical protein
VVPRFVVPRFAVLFDAVFAPRLVPLFAARFTPRFTPPFTPPPWAATFFRAFDFRADFVVGRLARLVVLPALRLAPFFAVVLPPRFRAAVRGPPARVPARLRDAFFAAIR